MITIKRSNCVILPLVVKRKWFDMIASGEKSEEYRLVTPYWEKRIINWMHRTAAPHNIVELRCGYARNAPRLAFDVLRVLRSDEWEIMNDQLRIPRRYLGEPDELHYIIPLNCRVKLVY